ncbi:MAG: FKBP-type peptidyl-prolyl cis-trans isomerase FkpA [Sphingomonadales bacterium]|jgi:FKBP-type peptidyl-prolyl cis-trans isomerase|nr:FKBP-type peptidyl-prolyl cis-trans isomerase FkpA [Sphingomonadales bacterium]
MVWLLLAAASAATPAASAHLPRGTIATATGLRIQTLKPGAGPRPGPDDAVLIRYVGRLANGKVFDRADRPAGMLVSGTVPGFAQALQLMRQGGTYRVWIPPRLAYGAAGAGGGIIPPNATLDFTITLLEIGRAAPPPPGQ